jgi:acetylornithine deacetylase/succinyl-diaminopimelate desuccinylase-like protein
MNTATRLNPNTLTAILALGRQGIAHARCVGMIECCEESGSYDLPAYLEALSARVGKVDLVIGLDSGCRRSRGKYFPEAQFLITGVLGPKSNAHGPNEFLHIPYAKKLTCCVAQVVAAHAQQ